MIRSAGVEPQGVDFVVVPTRDRDRAVRFYNETLGFDLNPRADERYPELEAGNVTLMIVAVEELGLEFTPLPPGAIAIRVADVDRARALLEHLGIAFRGATHDSGHCLEAFFADPDGNGLLLHRRYAP